MTCKKTVFRLAMLFVTLLMASMSLLTACSTESETTTPAATTGTATTTAPASTQPENKVIELTYSQWDSPASSVAVGAQKWVDRINEAGEGKVHITPYFAESLLKTADTYRGVQTGVADLAYFTVGTESGLHQLNRLTRLPFMNWPSQAAGTEIYQQLWDKYPEFSQEFEDLTVLGLRLTPPNQLNLVKGEARVPEDLKGMKIIGRSEWIEILKTVGAAPIDLGVGDWYTALERGMAEGQIQHFPGINGTKVIELLKTHVIFGDGGCSMVGDMFIANSEVWEGLPADVQDIILEATEWRVSMQNETDLGEIQKGIDVATAANHTFIYLTDEEVKQWADAVAPTYEKWIADCEARGLPGQAVFEEAKQMIEEYNQAEQ
jgi:TRAP-type C4-dicarboxylate transport system substrate-binding protein